MAELNLLEQLELFFYFLHWIYVIRSYTILCSTAKIRSWRLYFEDKDLSSLHMSSENETDIILVTLYDSSCVRLFVLFLKPKNFSIFHFGSHIFSHKQFIFRGTQDKKHTFSKLKSSPSRVDRR